MTTDAANPRPAAIVMAATYAAAGIGLAIGFFTMSATPASLRWATLLAVGVVGLLSFVRHSLLHRSDAARMGWDYGTRNNFQIEVGLANLAWGLVAIWSAIAGLGLAVDASLFMVEGLYLGAVALMQVVSPGGQRRSMSAMLGIGSFAVLLLALGVWGLATA